VNEEAVKQLTKQGCMLGKEAAEVLTEEDVERITELEATPMIVSGDMITSLRERMSQKVVVGSQGGTVKEEIETEVEGETSVDRVEESQTSESKAPVQQPQEKDEDNLDDADEVETNFDRKSAHFSNDKTVVLRDDGTRDQVETKVEVMDDYDVSRDEKDVPEFLQYYNDRYDKMKKMLMRRSEVRSATSVERLEIRR
jgi:hypothetical protein